MTKKKRNEAIIRVKHMEEVFDQLQAGVNADPPIIDETFLKTLMEYYTYGQWLKDYELDERGYLPADLKRGVLSEDGVYNLLDDIRQYQTPHHVVTDDNSELKPKSAIPGNKPWDSSSNQ